MREEEGNEYDHLSRSSGFVGVHDPLERAGPVTATLWYPITYGSYIEPFLQTTNLIFGPWPRLSPSSQTARSTHRKSEPRDPKTGPKTHQDGDAEGSVAAQDLAREGGDLEWPQDDRLGLEEASDRLTMHTDLVAADREAPKPPRDR